MNVLESRRPPFCMSTGGNPGEAGSNMFANVFPFPAIVGLRPTRLDLALAFESVEHRVERAIGPFHAVLGTGFDLMDDRVAIALPLREQGQNERFGGRGHEFPGGAFEEVPLMPLEPSI